MKINKDIEIDKDAEDEEFQEESGNRVGVYFQVKEVITDSTEWKTISPTLEPAKTILVKLEVLEDEVLDDKVEGYENCVVMTQKGFSEMLLRYAYKIIEVNKGKEVKYNG